MHESQDMWQKLFLLSKQILWAARVFGRSSDFVENSITETIK